MKKSILIISASIFVLISCQKAPKPGETSAVKMANEWWVTLDQPGQPDVFGIGHLRILTYNTSTNDNQLWVDDDKQGYGFKVKTTADYTNLTFVSAAAAANEYFVPGSTSFPATVILTEGKIFSKTAHSKAGNIADSIHMKLEFSDDPGTIYEMNGVERTRFPQDDY
ncbi:MAG: hypothetical protein H0W12_08420 [Chitinophagaceae bacterium]|nr:hypothetical protein [Chitinophagaceae bacterium]